MHDVLKDSIQAAVLRVSASKSNIQAALRKTLSTKHLNELTTMLECADSTLQSGVDRRRLAILQLGRSRDCRAFKLIEPFAADAWKVIRQAVASAAGDLGGQEGLRLALRLLGDSDSDVVRVSIAALKKVADPVAIRPLMMVGVHAPLLKVQTVNAILALGSSAVPELLEILESRIHLGHIDAVILLGRIGDKRAVPSLLMTLNRAEDGLRPRVVETLGMLGDRSAVAKIVESLSDSDQSVQLCAVKAVQRIPDRRAVKPLILILGRTKNVELRRQSVIALAATESEKSIPILKNLLPEADTALKKAIADGLGRVRSVDAAETLVSMLDDDSLAVISKALVGLRKNPLAAKVPELVLLCDHQEASIRRHALEALASSGNSESSEVLKQKLLSDSSTDVRAAAARACGKSGDKQFFPALEKALQDEPTVRCASLASLASLGERSSIPALIAHLKDPVPQVRYRAVEGLGRLEAIKAVHVIEELLNDTDEMVRTGAATALQSLGVKTNSVSLSSKVAGLASFWVPDSIAAVIPANAKSVSSVLLITVCVASWFLVPGAGASIDNSIALARARPLLQAGWLSGETDIILIRDGSQSDIWNATTGDFKDKVNVPIMTDCGSNFGLITRQGNTLVPWVPDGYQSDSRLVKLPLTDNFAMSGDGKFATYLDTDRRVWIWDTIEGKNISDINLNPEPLPVLSSDGSIVAGADGEGNIVLVSLSTGKRIGKFGALGNCNSQENGVFKKLLFSSSGNSLAVLRINHIIVGTVSGDDLLTVEFRKRIDPSLAQFPNPSEIFSACESTIVRFNPTTGVFKQWPVCARQLSINSFAISADGAMAAVSAEGKKSGWVVNLEDGSSRELSPLNWPAE